MKKAGLLGKISHRGRVNESVAYFRRRFASFDKYKLIIGRSAIRADDFNKYCIRVASNYIRLNYRGSKIDLIGCQRARRRRENTRWGPSQNSMCVTSTRNCMHCAGVHYCAALFSSISSRCVENSLISIIREFAHMRCLPNGKYLLYIYKCPGSGGKNERHIR